MRSVAVDPDVRPPTRISAPRAGAAILVEDLAKRYEKAGCAALRGLAFAVAPGESLALLGPNGAGKSTTINILATLLRPDSGRAFVCGWDVVREPARVRASLGVVLQESGLPRRQTPRRLLAYHARLLGLPRRDAAIRGGELLEAFALDAIADRQISACSRGERRRLDIALAVLRQPRVLLFDEPTTGLDSPSKRLIWRQLRLLLDGGTALLFSTHDLDEADIHADRIAIVREGNLVTAATPPELKGRYGSKSTTLSFPSEELAIRAANLLGVTPPDYGCSIIVDTGREEEALALLSRLSSAGLATSSFAITEPTLETVFDRMTNGSAPDRSGDSP